MLPEAIEVTDKPSGCIQRHPHVYLSQGVVFLSVLQGCQPEIFHIMLILVL